MSHPKRLIDDIASKLRLEYPTPPPSEEQQMRDQLRELRAKLRHARGLVQLNKLAASLQKLREKVEKLKQSGGSRANQSGKNSGSAEFDPQHLTLPITRRVGVNTYEAQSQVLDEVSKAAADGDIPNGTIRPQARKGAR
ncbi:MAG: hypothetical protein WBQ74_24310 [Candidatus Sulfotelmatobacter sp.]|jgi:stalled ribosome alternative rescue factor ArfA